MVRLPKELRKRKSKKRAVAGTAALVVGAAGLALFIVGLKRRHRLDEERSVGEQDTGRSGDHPDPEAPRRD
jgi:hypothetical protein